MIPTYSVVIPVYNAEKYLESCVDSILAQRTSSVYEVILVDDGSADGSPRLCDHLAERIPCVKALHQVNQGVSAARNAGIQAASGEYLLFLDADDRWDENLLENLDQELRHQPDLIEFGYLQFGEGRAYTPVLPAVQVSGVTGLAYLKSHEDKNTMPIASSCTVAFKRQLVWQHGLCFPVGVTYGEDMDFHIHALKQAQSVISICKPLYLYRMNEASVTHTLTVKRMRDMVRSCVNMYRLFPGALFANYYCLKILNLERLSRKDAAQVKDLLQENRDILRQVSGRKMKIARSLFYIFGWYDAARLVRRLIEMRNAEKG